MTNETNPFSAGSMIQNPHRFFGRRRELEQIMARLNGPQPQGTSIIGERRIGKSSLLHYIYKPRAEEVLRAQAGLFVVYFDAAQGECETPDQFRRMLLKTLLDECQLPTGGGRRRFSFPNQAEQTDAQWLTAQRKHLEGVDGEVSWAEARQLIQKIKAYKGHPVVCLDEFESLIERAEFKPSFFNALRSWQNGGTLTWITASKEKLSHVGKLHNKSSPFFNLLTVVELNPFEQETSNQLLATADDTSYAFTLREKQIIYNVTQGHPYHLQIVGAEVWRQKSAGESIRQKQLKQYLCNKADPPPIACDEKWYSTNRVQILSFLVVVLCMVIMFLLYTHEPAFRGRVQSMSQQITEWGVWDWLDSFGGGLSGLVMLILIMGVFVTAIRRRQRLGEIWAALKKVVGL